MRAVSKRLKTESEVALKDEAMQGALPSLSCLRMRQTLMQGGEPTTERVLQSQVLHPRRQQPMTSALGKSRTS